MTDYSQSGEQALILDWARRHGPGRFLDIGAADGKTASNTLALAEHGWPGVCVEAGAIQFDRLAHLYHDRPDVHCVQAAITVNEASLVRFHYSRDFVSTTEDENAEVWRELADFTPVWVAGLSVEELLARFAGPYAFASIDTEGTSIEIWDELRRRGAFTRGSLVVVEAENGGERWEIQRACLDGWARVATTPNNVLLERL